MESRQKARIGGVWWFATVKGKNSRALIAAEGGAMPHVVTTSAGDSVGPSQGEKLTLGCVDERGLADGS